jgi:CubicO group peptidase (beta-lactamase class C family)
VTATRENEAGGRRGPGATAAPSTHDATLMRGFPPPRDRRVAADQVYSDPRRTQWFMQHVREVAGTADVSTRHEPVVELAAAPAALDDLELVDSGDASAGAPPGTWSFAQMLAATDTDGMLVLRDGRVLCERYFGTLAPDTPHLWHSITKSLGSCVIANLVERGLVDTDGAVTAWVPELDSSAYAGATVRDLLDMTVGIQYTEDHEDLDSEDARLDRLCGLRPSRAPDEPGSIYDYATTTTGRGEHGGVLRYVSLNTDVLGWVMERATRVPVPELLRDEIWGKLGTEHDAYITVDGAGSALLDGGFCSSLRDLGRFGQMLAQDGLWNGRQVVPRRWLDDARSHGDRAAFAASDDPDMLPGGSYRSGFWVAEPEDGRTILLGIGMYGQMLYVDDEAGIVVAKLSSQPRAGPAGPIMRTFHALDSLARAIT